MLCFGPIIRSMVFLASVTHFLINSTHPQGSADLWVWSSFLNVSAANKKGHGIYNPKHSMASRVIPGSTWDITYGDGSGARKQILKFATFNFPVQNYEIADYRVPHSHRWERVYRYDQVQQRQHQGPSR